MLFYLHMYKYSKIKKNKKIEKIYFFFLPFLAPLAPLADLDFDFAFLASGGFAPGTNSTFLP